MAYNVWSITVKTIENTEAFQYLYVGFITLQCYKHEKNDGLGNNKQTVTSNMKIWNLQKGSFCFSILFSLLPYTVASSVCNPPDSPQPER